MTLTRRTFLKSVLAGLAGATVVRYAGAEAAAVVSPRRVRVFIGGHEIVGWMDEDKGVPWEWPERQADGGWR